MSIQDLIASVNDRLTPTERRIAEAISADPSLLTFGTVTDLARCVATSPPSIVRFASKLGFGGFRDLQSQARESLSQQMKRPSHRIRRPEGSTSPIRVAVEDAVHATFDALADDRLAALVEPIVSAPSVWILSGETSMAGAMALHSGLSMVREQVTLVHEHSAGSDLCGAASGDTAVVLDFARYRRSSICAARTLAERGVSIVAITDGPLSPLASLTQTWVGLTIPAVGPFDSSIPAVIAAELLVAQVVRQIGDEARDRIDQLEALWEATGTFLNYSPRPDPKPRAPRLPDQGSSSTARN